MSGGRLDRTEAAARLADIIAKTLAAWVLPGPLGTFVGESAGWGIQRVLGNPNQARLLRQEVRAVAVQVTRAALVRTEFRFGSNDVEAAALEVSITIAACPIDSELVRSSEFDGKRLFDYYEQAARARISTAALGDAEAVYRYMLRLASHGVASLLRESNHAHALALQDLLSRTRETAEAVADGRFGARLQSVDDAAFLKEYRGRAARRAPRTEFSGPGGILGEITCEHLYLEPIGQVDNNESPVLDILGERDVALIAGAAGAGKSYVLRALFLRRLSGAIPSFAGLVPFYADLRASREVPTPTEMLRQFDKFLADEAPQSWGERQFSSGSALVMLDGVEVLASKSDGLRELADVIQRWTSNGSRVILAARPLPALQEWTKQQGYAEIRPMPLSIRQVFEYIELWFEAAASSCRTVPEQALILSRGAELRLTLGYFSDLLSMCHDINFLSRLCVEYLRADENSPEDVMTLVTNVLSGIASDDAEIIGNEQPNALLELYGDLAHWATQNGDTFSLNTIASGVKVPEQRVHAIALNGSPICYNGQTWEFVNGAIRDHMAAADFVDRHYVGYLQESAREPKRQRLVVAAAGRMRASGLRDLLSGILSDAQSGSRDDAAKILTAYAAMHAATAVDADVRVAVNAAAHDLLSGQQRSAGCIGSSGAQAVLERSGAYGRCSGNASPGRGVADWIAWSFRKRGTTQTSICLDAAAVHG